MITQKNLLYIIVNKNNKKLSKKKTHNITFTLNGGILHFKTLKY